MAIVKLYNKLYSLRILLRLRKKKTCNNSTTLLFSEHLVNFYFPISTQDIKTTLEFFKFTNLHMRLKRHI